jgi:hypothetical protein
LSESIPNDEKLRYAFGKARKHCKYFPSVAEIVEFASSWQPPEKPRAIESHLREPEKALMEALASDPELKAIYESVMGIGKIPDDKIDEDSARADLERQKRELGL